MPAVNFAVNDAVTQWSSLWNSLTECWTWSQRQRIVGSQDCCRSEMNLKQQEGEKKYRNKSLAKRSTCTATNEICLLTSKVVLFLERMYLPPALWQILRTQGHYCTTSFGHVNPHANVSAWWSSWEHEQKENGSHSYAGSSMWLVERVRWSISLWNKHSLNVNFFLFFKFLSHWSEVKQQRPLERSALQHNYYSSIIPKQS